MPETPLVHIVLVNWNGLADTRACLSSLSSLEYSNARVIVVDNGSREDDAATLRSEFAWVTVLETGANLGFTGGNNVGIRHALAAGADYVLCLNNDTVVAPDFLGPLVQALQDDTQAGMAAAKIFHFDEPERVWFLGAECTFDANSAERGGPAWHPPHPERETWTEPFETQIATACALLIRADLLRRLRGFDDRYFAYFEDVDLNLRVEALGMRRLVVPASRVWHMISRASGGMQSPNLAYYIVRNTFLLAQTHAPLQMRGFYARRYAFLRWGDVTHIIRNPAATSEQLAQAQARLSALLCARLGLYGRRQSHPRIEALAAGGLRLARAWYRLRRVSGYDFVAGFLARCYWFVDTHALRRMKAAKP